ncbi:MAG: hypothetical protein WDO74_32455 [Pseudomonadota bacterium]
MIEVQKPQAAAALGAEEPKKAIELSEVPVNGPERDRQYGQNWFVRLRLSAQGQLRKGAGHELGV